MTLQTPTQPPALAATPASTLELTQPLPTAPARQAPAAAGDAPGGTTGGSSSGNAPGKTSRSCLEMHIELTYEIGPPGADFIFEVHAARTPQQRVLSENLQLSQPVDAICWVDPATATRSMRLQAQPGRLVLGYDVAVELEHRHDDPDTLDELPVHLLPTAVLPYLYPSRYCQSDRLLALAMAEFGHLPRGCSRVLAIRDWVTSRVAFRSASSNSTTSAIDTLIERVGVCRDFAHLMIALCRAVNIPARFATGTDYGADPALGPPDFQAYVEAYVGGRWYIFDPSGTAIPMGFVRFATGRDAADVAFATIFGAVRSHAPVIVTSAILDGERGYVLPRHSLYALSTDAGPASAGA
jgi:transglutaminase-like putative cysteine protease